MSSGFYRGTNIEQDVRYSDKEKKLLKQMKFETSLDTKIDLKRVNIDVLKPWIAAKVNALLGMEDDVVTEYVFTQLEEKNLNPKVMQINLTGFLNARRAREFMGELWGLLVEAQNSADGIPVSMINKKMEELKAGAAVRRDVPMAKATENDWKNRYQSLTGNRYGKDAPNYASMPGAGDSINDEPESPSNRRWRRERTPDNLPIPRRKRGDEDDRRDRNRDRDRSRDRDGRRYRERSKSPRRRRSRTPERRRRSRSPPRRPASRSASPPRRRRSRSKGSDSPVRRKFVEGRPRRSESPEQKRSDPPSPRPEKTRKRRDSDSDTERKRHKKSKKEKKEKKSKKDRD